MAEIAFENSQISNFEGVVTLTLDWVILHTAVHRSSTFNYTRIVIEIKETFRGRRETFETGFIRPILSKSRPKMHSIHPTVCYCHYTGQLVLASTPDEKWGIFCSFFLLRALDYDS